MSMARERGQATNRQAAQAAGRSVPVQARKINQRLSAEVKQRLLAEAERRHYLQTTLDLANHPPQRPTDLLGKARLDSGRRQLAPRQASRPARLKQAVEHHADRAWDNGLAARLRRLMGGRLCTESELGRDSVSHVLVPLPASATTVPAAG